MHTTLSKQVRSFTSCSHQTSAWKKNLIWPRHDCWCQVGLSISEAVSRVYSEWSKKQKAFSELQFHFVVVREIKREWTLVGADRKTAVTWISYMHYNPGDIWTLLREAVSVKVNVQIEVTIPCQPSTKSVLSPWMNTAVNWEFTVSKWATTAVCHNTESCSKGDSMSNHNNCWTSRP